MINNISLTYYKPNENGFTLIELIIVIVIIFIISIMTIPKMIDFSQDAQATATHAIAASLTSASADNYAARIILNTNGVAITNCTSAGNLLTTGLPVGYRIKSKSVKVNVSQNCTLTGPLSTSATFIVTGIK